MLTEFGSSLSVIRRPPAPSASYASRYRSRNCCRQIRWDDGGVSLASDDAARLLRGRHSQAQSQLSEL